MFLIFLISVLTSTPATIDGAKSGIWRDDEASYAENRIDARLDLGGDVGDDELAIVSAGNRTNAGSALRGDVEDDRLVVVVDGLATRDDGLAVDVDRLTA